MCERDEKNEPCDRGWERRQMSITEQVMNWKHNTHSYKKCCGQIIATAKVWNTKKTYVCIDPVGIPKSTPRIHRPSAPTFFFLASLMTATFTIIEPVIRVAAFCFFRLRSVFIGDPTILIVCLAVAWVIAPRFGQSYASKDAHLDVLTNAAMFNDDAQEGSAGSG